MNQKFIDHFIRELLKILTEQYQNLAEKIKNNSIKEDGSSSNNQDTNLACETTKFLSFLNGQADVYQTFEKNLHVGDPCQAALLSQAKEKLHSIFAAHDDLKKFLVRNIKEAAYELAIIFDHLITSYQEQRTNPIERLATVAAQRSGNYLRNMHLQGAQENISDLIIKGVFLGKQTDNQKHEDDEKLAATLTGCGLIETKKRRPAKQYCGKNKYLRHPISYHNNDGSRHLETLEYAENLQNCKLKKHGNQKRNKNYQPNYLFVGNKTITKYLKALHQKEPNAQKGFRAYLCKEYDKENVIPICRHLSLEKKDLSGGDFSSCVFLGVNLSGYDLRKCSFENAFLINIKYQLAIIDDTTNFKGADLDLTALASATDRRSSLLPPKKSADDQEYSTFPQRGMLPKKKTKSHLSFFERPIGQLVKPNDALSKLQQYLLKTLDLFYPESISIDCLKEILKPLVSIDTLPAAIAALKDYVEVKGSNISLKKPTALHVENLDNKESFLNILSFLEKAFDSLADNHSLSVFLEYLRKLKNCATKLKYHENKEWINFSINIGIKLFEFGDYKNCIALLSNIDSVKGELKLLHTCYLALAHQNSGDSKKAQKILDRLVAQDLEITQTPHNKLLLARAYNMLSHYYCSIGNPEFAIHWAETAAKLTLDNPSEQVESYIQQTYAHLYLNQIPEAKTTLAAARSVKNDAEKKLAPINISTEISFDLCEAMLDLARTINGINSAEELLKSLVQNAEGALKKLKTHHSYSLSTIAHAILSNAYIELGEYDAAIEHANSGISDTEKSHGYNHYRMLELHMNLICAYLYKYLKNKDENLLTTLQNQLVKLEKHSASLIEDEKLKHDLKTCTSYLKRFSPQGMVKTLFSLSEKIITEIAGKKHPYALLQNKRKLLALTLLSTEESKRIIGSTNDAPNHIFRPK